jgi:hypothetical protein
MQPSRRIGTRSTLTKRSPFCFGRKYLGQIKTRTAHLAIRPDLKISDREVLEKRVGLYDLLALDPARCVGTCHNERRVSILRR